MCLLRSRKNVDIQNPYKIKFAKSGLQFIKKVLFFCVRLVFPGIDPSKHSVIISEASYSPWLLDQAFQETYQKIKNFMKIDEYRAFELWKIIEQVKNVEGGIIEIGVWRGGSGCLIAKKCQLEKIPNVINLCDTFEGVVKASKKDPFYIGKEHADTDQVFVSNLANEMDLNNIKILKGVFPDQTGKLVKDSQFRFCHIDVDTYQSCKDILDWIWNKMSVNGIIVFDDFGAFVAGGITEIVEDEAKKPDRITIYNLNGHAIMIKIKPNI